MTDTTQVVSKEAPGGSVAARPSSDTTNVALVALVLVGAGAFAYGAAAFAPLRAWQAYLVNFLFFIGISQAGAVFLTILALTRSGWGRPFERYAAAMTAFLPVGFLLFLLLPLGRTVLFSWVRDPIPEKAMWLNFTFMMVRDGVGLAILIAFSLALVYHRIRPLAFTLEPGSSGWRRHVYGLFTHRFQGLEAEIERSRGRMQPLALGVTAAYALVFSLLAGDLIMSLDPHWYSTLFGAYNFVVCLYAGLAALAVLSLTGRYGASGRAGIGADALHDLGKLIFAFALVAGDFFWSQFLVIWYGNLPEEISFVVRRLQQQPWTALSWTVLLGFFVVPFTLLLAREPKRNPRMLLPVCGLILIAGWLERYMLVVPSLTPAGEASFGILEVLITLGFLATFLLAFRAFLAAFPPDASLPAESPAP